MEHGVGLWYNIKVTAERVAIIRRSAGDSRSCASYCRWQDSSQLKGGL